MGTISDPKTLQAFVERCAALGLTEEQTKEAVWLHGRNEFLTDPEIAKGFASVLADYHGPLTKAALAKYMTPDVIACAVECRMSFGDTPLAEELRKEAGYGRQPQDFIRPGLLDHFNGLSIPQKALVSAMIGGGANGAYRYFNPNDEDAREGRGAVERGVRGAGQGAVTGLGALAGAELGQRLSPAIGMSRPMGFVGGGVAGAVAGHNMLHR